MQLFKVLTDEELLTIRNAFKVLNWSDGKASAKGGAQDIKSNLQAYPTDPAFKNIQAILERIFFTSIVKNYVFAKELVGLRANSYGPGDHYGWHVDMSHMGKWRTDMSFTLFLTPPDEYDGGELQMQWAGLTTQVKPNAGEMVIYPTGVLHQVNEVTKGKREAVVGWIESFIPNHDGREALFRIASMNDLIRKHTKDGSAITTEQAETMNQAYFQLIRILSP